MVLHRIIHPSRRLNQHSATVAYADIFDYPLTRSEARLWMVGKTQSIRTIDTRVETVGDYLVLPGRGHIVDVRKKRQRVATHKWKKVCRIVNMFIWIPTVVLVGVTGGLAMNNAKARDDIDLFFITRTGTLWISRLLVTAVSELMKVRRRPEEENVSDKICLNMFMAEDALRLPKQEQDLFTAHEVLQMVPLWERGGIYAKFLRANRWVGEFLPNAWKEKCQMINLPAGRVGDKWPIKKHLVFSIVEPLARVLQLWYMKKRRTNEVIRAGQIRFHPRDAREWVRENYAVRLAKWNIPLDKIFYHR